MNKGRSVVPSAKEGLKKVGYNINQHTQLKTAIFLLVSEQQDLEATPAEDAPTIR